MMGQASLDVPRPLHHGILSRAHWRARRAAEDTARATVIAAIERQRATVGLREDARIAERAGGLLRERAERQLWCYTPATRHLRGEPAIVPRAMRGTA